MKIEYFSYYSVKKKHGKSRIGIGDIRKKLPADVCAELLSPPSDCPVPQILVESHKHRVIEYLDKFIQIEKRNFSKRYKVEITEDEIDNYQCFFIDMRNLVLGKHIEYQFDFPTCATEICPWGFKITSPTQIKNRHIRNLDIGKIYSNWERTPRFILSKRLKEVFSKQHVTGIRYDACPVMYSHEGQESKIISDDSFNIAEITNSTKEFAQEIFIHDWCQNHRVIVDYDCCGVFFSEAALPAYDIQMIDKTVVNDKEYYYRHADFFVSKKVLRILLEYCPGNLRPRSFLLKKPFMPVHFGYPY